MNKYVYEQKVYTADFKKYPPLPATDSFNNSSTIKIVDTAMLNSISDDVILRARERWHNFLC